QTRETKFAVLLPEPVGRQRRQTAKARLAFAHFTLGARAFGDVGIDGDETAAGDGQATNLEHRAVGPNTFEVMRFELARDLHARAHLFLHVTRPVVAALGVVTIERLIRGSG